jgi:hypothetical protein
MNAPRVQQPRVASAIALASPGMTAGKAPRRTRNAGFQPVPNAAASVLWRTIDSSRGEHGSVARSGMPDRALPAHADTALSTGPCHPIRQTGRAALRSKAGFAGRRYKSAALRRGRRSRAVGRGAISIEYLLILTFVVIPIALMMPMFIRMIRTYGDRNFTYLRLPFP